MRILGRCAARMIGFGVLLLATTGLQAQPRLDIQGVELSIGMPRAVALPKLKAFALHCVGKESNDPATCASVLVTRKVSEEPRFEVVANISFVDNRIKKIYKYWHEGYEGSDPTRFVETLFALLSSHERDGGAPFVVSTGERRDPGARQHAVYLTSGRKTISMILVEGYRVEGKRQPASVSLSEVIE